MITHSDLTQCGIGQEVVGRDGEVLLEFALSLHERLLIFANGQQGRCHAIVRFRVAGIFGDDSLEFRDGPRCKIRMPVGQSDRHMERRCIRTRRLDPIECLYRAFLFVNTQTYRGEFILVGEIGIERDCRFQLFPGILVAEHSAQREPQNLVGLRLQAGIERVLIQKPSGQRLRMIEVSGSRCSSGVIQFEGW